MTTLQIATAFLPVPIGLSGALVVAVAWLRPSRWLRLGHGDGRGGHDG